MKISILTVNYNTEQHIVVLLEMLSQQTLARSDFEVIITNNVQNPTLATLIQPFTQTLNLHIVQSSHNVGFGRANNMAAAQATGEHLLIMNPDIRMLQPDYLEKLYIQAIKNQNYGLITTQILDEAHHDQSEFYTYEFKRNLGYDDQVCWFSGALLLISKTVFERIGGFDPDFFMYCEDVDLCYRVKKLDLAMIKVDDLQVHHIGGASEPDKGYDLHYRWYRSRILFAHKHFAAKEFDALIQQLQRKAIRKIVTYTILGVFGYKRFKFKKMQWHVMRDIVQKTQQESPAWLYFKI